MIEFVDIIFGLQWGDEGKGKISNALADQYDFVCRFNGGPNAGHTVYINDQKYKTHIIPCGIFKNKASIIGPNCVLNLDKFYQEIEYLKSNGFDTDLIKVSPNAHIITDKHIEYDKNFLREIYGTTGQGIAPCYSDKMLRQGEQAKSKLDKKFLWDGQLYGKILCEGAQSFWLDINYGNYPYVTSSETLPYSACSLGFSPKKIKDIIGVAKIYDTKSGVDPLFPKTLLEDKSLSKLIELGQEFGTTTGRKRIANWVNLDALIFAINKSGCNILYINKCDILKQLELYKAFYNSKLLSFNTLEEMQSFLSSKLLENGVNIRYSSTKYGI